MPSCLNPTLLYARLPYPVDFVPYTGRHVVSTLGLLGFTGLGFFLLLSHLDPEPTISLDTDYEVHRHLLGGARAYSDSYSTRIAQVEHAGEPGEVELPPGKDGGYLWRLNSYWRYFDTGHGVYVQCEAVSLTRDIPTGLGWLIGPFIDAWLKVYPEDRAGARKL